METMKYVTLHSGTQIPVIGMGTSVNKDDPAFLTSAITDLGYRMIDTASYYKNEEMIGEAVQSAIEKGIPREDLFIITKIYNDKYDDIENECRKSLEKLKLDYIDLYMLHFPYNSYGKETKSILGTDTHLEKLMQSLEIRS